MSELRETTVERNESSVRAPGPGFLFAVLILFLATGMSGLIYQVVWQRYLLNVFGATIYSITTVLAAYMGGLALGSRLFGIFGDRLRRPLLVYGVAEICIGLAALTIPHLLGLLDPLFVFAYRNYGSNFITYSLIRFVFVFLLLLIPTTLMGGTFPVLARFAAPQGRSAGRRIGLLYALNTAGAVTGTILSGFFFIRWWGVSNTVLAAALINIGAGIIAILMSRRSSFDSPVAVTDTVDSSAELSAAQTAVARRVSWAYFVSGFVALGLEIVWSRSLVFTFEALKNTTYSFTAMLAVFLVGIAAGSAVMTPFVEKERHPYRLFAALQILIGLTAILSFFILYFKAYDLGDEWLRSFDQSGGNIRWNAAVAVVFLKTAAVLFLPTFCMGLAFPVAVRAAVGNTRVAQGVGKLYALNTVGAILGAVFTGFLLLPWVGITNSIFVLGTAQLLAGLYLVLKDPEQEQARRPFWITIAVLPLLIAALGYLRVPRPVIFQQQITTETPVFYKEGPFATVSVQENTLGYRTIYVDNVGVAGTDPMLLTDQKSLAHVPMLLLKDPKSALTVGFGSGGASYSYTLYPELERIDCVEITKTVTEAAPTLTDSNRGVIYRGDEDSPNADGKPAADAGARRLPLWDDGGKSGWFKSDARYNIILDDVRSYLRFTDHRYDIIATDCTDLRYKSNANLYDLQYFELTRDRITDDGMVCVWMPLGGLSDEAIKVALRTFYHVFPDMEVFYMNNEPTHYILLLGTKGPLKIDPAAMAAKLTRAQVKKDLDELFLGTPEKVVSCFVTGRDRLQEYLKGSILNTEDFPYLEFESPRYGYGDAPLLNNLDELMRFREHPERLVTDAGASFSQSLEKYYAAVPHIIDGHHDYRELRMEDAAIHYMKALDVNPADASVRNMLEFPELRRKVEGQPGNTWSQWTLGRILLAQKRDAEAASQFNQLLEKPIPQDPDSRKFAHEIRKDSLVKLSAIYERAGSTQRAAELREAASLEPVL